jgi:hypothetical protein
MFGKDGKSISFQSAGLPTLKCASLLRLSALVVAGVCHFSTRVLFLGFFCLLRCSFFFFGLGVFLAI